jgi:hypothetical protein
MGSGQISGLPLHDLEVEWREAIWEICYCSTGHASFLETSFLLPYLLVYQCNLCTVEEKVQILILYYYF